MNVYTYIFLLGGFGGFFVVVLFFRGVEEN